LKREPITARSAADTPDMWKTQFSKGIKCALSDSIKNCIEIVERDKISQRYLIDIDGIGEEPAQT